MSVEEKLKSVQEAAERIRQIDLDSNKEKKIIYKNVVRDTIYCTTDLGFLGRLRRLLTVDVRGVQLGQRNC